MREKILLVQAAIVFTNANDDVNLQDFCEMQ